MKRICLFLFVSLFAIPFNANAQAAIEKNYNTFDEFLDEQNAKITEIETGLNKADVLEIMGAEMIVKVPKVGRKKPLNQLFKQPEFSNEYNSNATKKINILWYFSTPKDQNGIISKRECTPVIIENDKVVGKGWAFFNSYRKRVYLR